MNEAGDFCNGLRLRTLHPALKKYELENNEDQRYAELHCSD
jgi:hypothetical protein